MSYEKNKQVRQADLFKRQTLVFIITITILTETVAVHVGKSWHRLRNYISARYAENLVNPKAALTILGVFLLYSSTYGI